MRAKLTVIQCSRLKIVLEDNPIYKIDKIESQVFDAIIPGFLNALTRFRLLNHKIKLKIETSVMLLKNLDQVEGD